MRAPRARGPRPRRSVGIRDALGELAVEEQEGRTLVARALELLGELRGGLLLLDLLAHEPLQQRQAREVAFAGRERMELVDAVRHLALVAQRLLEDLAQRAELGGRLVDRRQYHAAPAIVQELEELH